MHSMKQEIKINSFNFYYTGFGKTGDQVADISVAIAEKVISKNLSAADQKDLVDQFIKGLND